MAQQSKPPGSKPPLGAPKGLSHRHNLATLLGLLHRHGSRTRSELTRLTGLNRSTIAALVGELIELHLAYETASDLRQIGRPSPRVHADQRITALTVNPDIDAVTVGLVGLGGHLHYQARHLTPAPLTARGTVEFLDTIVPDLLADHAQGLIVLGIGLAVPGLVNTGEGMVTFAPHLGWRSEPFAEQIEKAFDLPARVANDAFVATLAESRHGAGTGVEDLVYLNGSASGIGGGVMVHGTPLRGLSGYAGELGHTVVNPQGRSCHCGRRGCLETEVTRAGLLDALGVGDSASDQLEELLVSSTRPAVAAELARQRSWLTIALANFTHIFDPELIILGGFLAALFRTAPESIVRGVLDQRFDIAQPVRVESARLGSSLLTVGAAELVFADVLAHPQHVRSLLPSPAGDVEPALEYPYPANR